MSHGGDFSGQGSNEVQASETDTSSPPAPPIRGVMPLEENPAEKSPPSSFEGADVGRSEDCDSAAAEPTLFDGVKPRVEPNAESGDEAEQSGHSLDPWGAQEKGEEEEPEPEPLAFFGRRRGGGTLTIPLICIGLAIIGCVTLLPMADDLHQLSWEREKLKADLAHLKEQVRVNEEFLARLSDDPTLAERLAQRQMKVIREGQKALAVRAIGREEISPFQLISVPPPEPLPPYQPVGGMLATLVRAPRARVYLSGAGLLLVAIGLVLGYVPRDEGKASGEA